jgi:hypothetical protein
MSDTRSGRALQQAANAMQRSADAMRQSDIARANSQRAIHLLKTTPAPVTFENVRVVAEGRPRGMGRLVCEVGRRRITFHPNHMLEGSTVRETRDVGTLVIPHWGGADARPR